MTSITKRITAIFIAAVMLLICIPFFCTSEAYASSESIDISELDAEHLTVTLVGATYDSTINGTGGWYYTYTGKAIMPDLSILYKDTDGNYRELVCYEDYNVSNDDYVNNLNVGIATVTIHGIHDFTGDITRSFFILPKSTIPTVELGSYSLVYNGKAQLPKITVRDGYTVLTLGEENDYTLAITKAGRGKDVGQYAVQANLKNNYTGKNRTYYTIIPKGTYKTVDGTRYYSRWSAIKAKVTKK